MSDEDVSGASHGVRHIVALSNGTKCISADAAGSAAAPHAESAAARTGSRSLEAASGLRRAGALTVIRQCVAHQVSDRIRDGIGLRDGGGGGFDAGDIQRG